MSDQVCANCSSWVVEENDVHGGKDTFCCELSRYLGLDGIVTAVDTGAEFSCSLWNYMGNIRTKE